MVWFYSLFLGGWVLRFENVVFPDGYWNVTAANSFACTDYNLTLNGTGFTSTYTIDADTRIIKRTNGGAWGLDGTHSAASSPNCYRNGITGGISTLSTQFGFGLRYCLGGTIASAVSTICAGEDVNNLTNSVLPSGGTDYHYVWQYNENLSAIPGDGDPGWADIAGTDNPEYDPGPINVSTQYVRKATADAGCTGSQYTNAIQITVNPLPVSGNVFTIPN